MNKKNIKAFLLIIVTAVITVAFFYSPLFETEANFFIRNAAFVTTIIFAAVTFISVKRYSKPIAIAEVLLLIFIYAIFSWAIFLDSEAFTRTAITITQAMIIIFAMICGIITREKTKEKIKNEVSKYVAMQVLDSIDEDTPQAKKGKKEILTIMFIDIRRFTTISEQHTAEEVMNILNNYFKEIIPVIKKHNGIINKFIGDALLVIFQGKTPEEQAKNAVIAGNAILRKLKNFQIMQEAMGKEKITAGIGINTGEVFIGNIGTEDRCEYTVIGDTVNIASRTESVNRTYKTEFLITENTYKFVKDIADVIKISDVELKGKREKINIYEVLRISENI